MLRNQPRSILKFTYCRISHLPYLTYFRSMNYENIFFIKHNIKRDITVITAQKLRNIDTNYKGILQTFPMLPLNGEITHNAANYTRTTPGGIIHAPYSFRNFLNNFCMPYVGTLQVCIKCIIR